MAIPIPPPEVALVKPETGLIDADWHDYFRGQGVGGSSGGTFGASFQPSRAKADQTTDNAALIQDELNALSSQFGGGLLYFPPGNPYLVKSTITVPPSVAILGGGVGNCSIMTRDDVTVFNVTGDYAQIINLTVLGKGTNNDTGSFGATQPAVQMDGVEAKMLHARVVGGATCIRCTKDDTYLDDVTAVQSYGPSIVTVDAVTFMSRCKLDQGWPVSVPPPATSFANWVASTLYTIGTVVSVLVGPNIWYIQCKVAGTSGAIQPALKNYEIDIPDPAPSGPLIWRLVCRADMDVVRLDAGEFHASGPCTDISSVGRYGVLINGATLTFLDNLVIGQQWGSSIRADTGASLFVSHCELNNGVNPNTSAVAIGGGWSSDIALTDNTIFGYGGAVGSNIGVDIGGGVDCRIRGNTFKQVSTGVIVRAGVKRFMVDGNSFQNCSRWLDTPATSDTYIATNNLVSTSGAASDLGVAPKTVTGNV